MEKNGQTAKPAIVIYWNNDQQEYQFVTDETQLKNADMVASVLGMCHEKAKFNVHAINMQVLQRMAMQQAQEQAVKRSILGG